MTDPRPAAVSRPGSPDRADSPEPICWSCGASNDPGSSECWLCQRRDWNQPLDPGPRPAIEGWLVPCVVLAAGIGLFRVAPVVAIFLVVELAPALFFAELKASRLRERGESMPVVDRMALVVMAMIAIPILILLALAIGLFLMCATR